MWSTQFTEVTSATPAQLWRQYEDPLRWPEWDHDTKQVTIDGPLAVGARGRITPRGGPSASFVVTRAVPQEGFTSVTRLPLARLTFDHRISIGDDGCRFTHDVRIQGPLAPVFGRIIGRGIAKTLPETMRSLARLAQRS